MSRVSNIMEEDNVEFKVGKITVSPLQELQSSEKVEEGEKKNFQEEKKRHPVCTYLDPVKISKPLVSKFHGNAEFHHPILHIVLIVFTFGYYNALTFEHFGIFATVMTGNGVAFFIAFQEQNYTFAAFLLLVIFSHSFAGTLLDCFLLEWCQDRRLAYFYIILFLTINGIGAAILDHFSILSLNYSWILSILLGAQVHWSSKFGFVLPYQTGNMVRITEQLFKLVVGYDMGNQKARGDAFSLLYILSSFYLGVILGVLGYAYFPAGLRELIVLLLYPVMFYVADCGSVVNFRFTYQR